jgi:uncharacterized protein YoaH (UPF0181 family)
VDPLAHWDASLQPLGLGLALALPAAAATAAVALPRFAGAPSSGELAQLADCYEEVTSRFGGVGYRPDFQEPPRVAAVLGSAVGLGWAARREALHLLQQFMLEGWSAGGAAAGAAEAGRWSAERAGTRCGAAAALDAQQLRRLRGVRLGLAMVQVGIT